MHAQCHRLYRRFHVRPRQDHRAPIRPRDLTAHIDKDRPVVGIEPDCAGQLCRLRVEAERLHVDATRRGQHRVHVNTHIGSEKLSRLRCDKRGNVAAQIGPDTPVGLATVHLNRQRAKDDLPRHTVLSVGRQCDVSREIIQRAGACNGQIQRGLPGQVHHAPGNAPRGFIEFHLHGDLGCRPRKTALRQVSALRIVDPVRFQIDESPFVIKTRIGRHAQFRRRPQNRGPQGDALHFEKFDIHRHRQVRQGKLLGLSRRDFCGLLGFGQSRQL